MKAKMQLVNASNDVVIKVFDWNDLIDTSNGKKLVKEISVYDDNPIIDGEEFKIIHMLSANDFNDTLTANPYSNNYSSVRYS